MVHASVFFPWKEGLQWNKLKIHAVGKYSISRPRESQQIADAIVATMKKVRGNAYTPGTIMDGTACVGGDTLRFAQTFQHVIAVEKDAATYAMLQNNISVYELPESKVRSICNNFLAVLSEMQMIPPNCDVIYMDPPWNPPGRAWYTRLKNLMLFMDHVPVDQVVRDIFNTTQEPSPDLVAIKCPANFDVRRFVKALPGIPVILQPVHTFFVLMCINPRCNFQNNITLPCFAE